MVPYLRLSFSGPHLGYTIHLFNKLRMTRIELADKLYELITILLFLCFAKVDLSNRLQPEIAPTTRCITNFQESIFAPFVGNGTKVKLPSEIKPPLFIVIYCVEKYKEEERADIMVKNNSCLILL